jgi:hypothetical protein
MKSYTDLEQSKKLAEMLPLESADMEYLSLKVTNATIGSVPFVKDDSEVKNSAYDAVYERTPCWSLVSLLEVLKQHCERLETTVRVNKNYNVFASGNGFTYRSFDEYPDGISNLIDAYYEIVIHLNELNLL